MAPGHLPHTIKEVGLAAAKIALDQLEARAHQELIAKVFVLEDLEIGLVADVDQLDAELGGLPALAEALKDMRGDLFFLQSVQIGCAHDSSPRRMKRMER